MNILVISASMRKKSQSRKVSEYLAARVKKLDHSATVLDLHELKLPFFGQHEEGDIAVKQLGEHIDEADAYVFVSPEWSGSLSAGLVNMMHFVGDEMSHKPVMLVGVSGTTGGTYPIAQMRQIGPKNTHYVISPENLIVRDVQSVMNDNEIDEDATDYRVKSRAEYSLKVLVEYARALKVVQDSDVADSDSFSSGV